MQRGLVGAETARFLSPGHLSIFLGARAGDTLDDLFPGSGAVQMRLGGTHAIPATKWISRRCSRRSPRNDHRMAHGDGRRHQVLPRHLARFPHRVVVVMNKRATHLPTAAPVVPEHARDQRSRSPSILRLSKSRPPARFRVTASSGGASITPTTPGRCRGSSNRSGHRGRVRRICSSSISAAPFTVELKTEVGIVFGCPARRPGGLSGGEMRGRGSNRRGGGPLRSLWFIGKFPEQDGHVVL